MIAAQQYFQQQVKVQIPKKVYGVYKNPFTQNIYNKVWKQNRNALVAVLGASGAGKSYCSIRQAWDLDPNFDIEQNVVFSTKDFFNAIHAPWCKKGTAIVFEEVGVNVGSRQWYNNKEIIDLLQTFRHRNLIVFMNVPNLYLLDKSVRRLFHYEIEALRVDYSSKLNMWKGKEINFLQSFDKLIKPRLTGWDAKGDYGVFKRYDTKAAPKHIMNRYEERAAEYKMQLSEALGKKLDEKEKVVVSKIDARRKKVEDIISQKKDVIRVIEQNPLLFEKRIGYRYIIDKKILRQKFPLIKTAILEDVKTYVEGLPYFKKKNMMLTDSMSNI